MSIWGNNMASSTKTGCGIIWSDLCHSYSLAAGAVGVQRIMFMISYHGCYRSSVPWPRVSIKGLWKNGSRLFKMAVIFGQKPERAKWRPGAVLTLDQFSQNHENLSRKARIVLIEDESIFRTFVGKPPLGFGRHANALAYTLFYV